MVVQDFGSFRLSQRGGGSVAIISEAFSACQHVLESESAERPRWLSGYRWSWVDCHRKLSSNHPQREHLAATAPAIAEVDHSVLLVLTIVGRSVLVRPATRWFR